MTDTQINESTLDKEWFADWFNTKYYHILYQDRNDEEAQLFMRNLVDFLVLKKNIKILDLACGRGRHAVYLNSLVFDVTGVDLSPNSITYAKQFEKEKLKFSVHDMREPFTNTYHAILNLFTSFGYFDDDATNIKVLSNIKNGLKKDGVAVIDFLNIKTVIKNLKPTDVLVKDGIQFDITRKILNNKIIKDIKFQANDTNYHYTEKVQCLTLETIKNYMDKAGLQLKHVFGDYNLQEFDVEKSNRLILIVSKK